MDSKEEIKVKNIIDKLYNRKQSKGRKLKPGNKQALQNMINAQCNSKPIITLGVYQMLPKDIAAKIHDKKLSDTLSEKEKKTILDIIKEKKNNPDCFIRIRDKNVFEDHSKLNFRTIFNTQERQLIMG